MPLQTPKIRSFSEVAKAKKEHRQPLPHQRFPAIGRPGSEGAIERSLTKKVSSKLPRVGIEGPHIKGGKPTTLGAMYRKRTK